MEADFIASQQLLREHGCNTNFLIYPGGRTPTNTETWNLVKRYFMGGVLANRVATNTTPINPHKLRRHSIYDSDNKVTINYNGVDTEFYSL